MKTLLVISITIATFGTLIADATKTLHKLHNGKGLNAKIVYVERHIPEPSGQESPTIDDLLNKDLDPGYYEFSGKYVDGKTHYTKFITFPRVQVAKIVEAYRKGEDVTVLWSKKRAYTFVYQDGICSCYRADNKLPRQPIFSLGERHISSLEKNLKKYKK